jgi:uncharacterized membrane protein
MHEWLALIGIPIMVLGFALRLNALLVVVIAGAVTGLASGIGVDALLQLFGEKFLASRQLAAFVLIFPVIGLLELFGLRERAQWLIGRIRSATSARILMLYFVIREATGVLGLTQIAGQVQTVRPLLAPMVEGAAANRYGELPLEVRELLRAHAAACDNIAIFFSEDIFIAFGAVLLIDSFLKDSGIAGISPLHIGLWGIPTALGALVIHFTRLARLDRAIAQKMAVYQSNGPDAGEVTT